MKAHQIKRIAGKLFGRWRDSEGNVEVVRTPSENVSQVVRARGFSRPDSIACQLTDTGNGFIACFPAHHCTDQDYYLCMDYDQARSLVLALTPHRQALGFKDDNK